MAAPPSRRTTTWQPAAVTGLLLFAGVAGYAIFAGHTYEATSGSEVGMIATCVLAFLAGAAVLTAAWIGVGTMVRRRRSAVIHEFRPRAKDDAARKRAG